MASIWKLNGADIYVDTYNVTETAQVAEKNPINSSSSNFHVVFSQTPIYNIGGTVVGTGYLTTIRATKGNTVTLISDLVPAGESVLVIDVQVQRLNVYSQHIDSTQPSTAPVYKVTITARPT